MRATALMAGLRSAAELSLNQAKRPILRSGVFFGPDSMHCGERTVPTGMAAPKPSTLVS